LKALGAVSGCVGPTDEPETAKQLQENTLKSYTLEACGDKDAQRILRNGEIVAFALRLSNGKWGAYDAEDKPITNAKFSSANAVLKWFVMVKE
jgi:hypothetical protein